MSNCHLECRNCAGCLHNATPELPERLTPAELDGLGYLTLAHLYSSMAERDARAIGQYELASRFNARTLMLEEKIRPLAERALLEIVLYGEITL
jgi:hypothetical protein